MDFIDSILLEGEPLTLQVFVMRSMASGGAFHRAYLHATQQAFLEAHEHAFQYFGGVFQQLRPQFSGEADITWFARRGDRPLCGVPVPLAV